LDQAHDAIADDDGDAINWTSSMESLVSKCKTGVRASLADVATTAMLLVVTCPMKLGQSCRLRPITSERAYEFLPGLSAILEAHAALVKLST
jgi:hypothetical protein